MAYIVDIIIIVIFGTIIISSVKKGFFKSLFELTGTLISLILARILSEGFAAQAYNMFIRKGAESYLSNALGSVGTTDYAQQAEQVLNSIPEALNGIMSLIGVDKQAILDKVSSASGGTNLVDSLMTNVIEPIGTAIVQFILFVLLAVAIGFILKFVVKLLDAIIKKLPAVKQLNSTLGAVFGVLRGLIVVVIISMLIGVVSSFIANEAILEAVNNSIIISTVQNFISVVSGAAV